MRTTFFRALALLAALAPAQSAAQTCSGSTTVTCVTASSPLSSTGGRTPQISLSGVVPIGNGGTGIASSPAGAGYYLRSSGAATWALGTIQAGDIPNLGSSYVAIGASAGGSLAGTYPNPSIAASGVTAGTYGSSTAIPVIAINTEGRITGVTTASVSGSIAVGGDLSGTASAATVAKINGVSLGSTTATSGNLLVANGTSWISVPASGDISLASSGAVAVTRINGTALGTLTGATNGQALAWNGTAWTPTTYVAGTVNVSAPISGNGAGSALGLSYGSGLTVSGGALVPDFGTTSGKTAQGNDSRFPPAPSSAGRVLYDSGTAWTALAAGTSGQLLRGGSTPAWTTALTNGQILIGSTGSSPVAASLTNGGGITATGGAGTITLGSSAGGDIAGTVASATVGGLQGRTVSNAAPSTGDVLAWDGSQWTPGQVTYVNGINISVSSANLIFAGPASGASAAPTFRQQVFNDLPSPPNTTAPGLSVSLPYLTYRVGGTTSAGNYTVGAYCVADWDMSISGAYFYWTPAGSKTVTVKLWNSAGTLLKSTTVAVTGAGFYSATFPSAQSINAGSQFYISHYESTVQNYVAPTSIKRKIATNTTPEPVGMGLSCAFGYFGAGDAAPTSSATTLAAPIHPQYQWQ